jgi:Zn-dependent metalloprotease
MKCRIPVFAALILGAFPAPAAAGTLEEATRAFLAAHPGAELIADESAARWSLIHGFATEPAAGDPADIARAFVAGHAALIGLAGAGSGAALDRVVPHRSRRYVRFEQTFLGRPVFDATVIVGVDGAGRVFQVSSTAVASPAWRGKPPVDGPAAVAAAAKGVAGLGAAIDLTLGSLATGDTAAPAWRVVAPGAGFHLWVTYVDAWSGAVLWREDLSRRHDALAFPENPVVDEGQTTQVFLPNIVQEGAHVNHTFGSMARVGTCTATDEYGMCVDWTHAAVADGNGFLDTLPLLSDPTALPDGFAEVNAYYHLDLQNAWMRAEFGYDGLYIDAETALEETHIWAYTSLDWANAAFSGGGWGYPDSIIFGQGNLYGVPIDFAYDADVILHEFTHSVSDKAFNIRFGSRDEWGYNSTPGAVEEGNADYYALTRTGNPALAEYALGIYGRNADNDHRCPDDLQGEGHYDGEIVGGALWDLRNQLGAAKTDHLQYGALAGATIRSFDNWAEALLAQAEVMKDEVGELQFDDADVAALQAVIDERGLVGCIRVVRLWVDGAAVSRLHYCAWDVTQGQGTPSAIQYLAPTFDDTQVLKLLVSPAGDKNYDVLVRKGQPVFFTWSEGGYPYTWEAEYDYKWAGNIAVPITEVKISELTEFAIEPGADYHFSIVCRPNADGCRSGVTMSLSTEPDVEEDAGPDADTDTDGDTDTDTDTGADAGTGGDGSGCGCRAAKAREASLASALLALVR